MNKMVLRQSPCMLPRRVLIYSPVSFSTRTLIEKSLTRRLRRRGSPGGMRLWGILQSFPLSTVPKNFAHIKYKSMHCIVTRCYHSGFV